MYKQAHAHACATLSTIMASRDPRSGLTRGPVTGAASESCGRRFPTPGPVTGASVGAIGPNDFPPQANGYGQPSGDQCQAALDAMGVRLRTSQARRRADVVTPGIVTAPTPPHVVHDRKFARWGWRLSGP